MDKKKIKEKARETAKFTYEVIDDIFGNGFGSLICKIIVRCGENVGKIGYKNGLQVSVGHLCVPLTVLFSNEFLRDLSRLWELRTIVPDPSNPTLIIR